MMLWAKSFYGRSGPYLSINLNELWLKGVIDLIVYLMYV